MKKLFQIIGLISLMGFSFFYTEKTVSVIKEYDEIMIEIKNIKSKYQKKYINAYIKNDTIIPGISGVEVDINKSYSKMKKYGSFDESLIVLKKIEPKISINNNNKYIISGNKNKRNVSILFVIKDNDNIDKLVNILDNKKIKGNFIINDNWLEKNTNLVPILIKEKHNVGIFEYDGFDYSYSVIKKIGKQKNIYCYLIKKNTDVLKKCSNNYTIIPNIIINKNPYENTKKITNGSIISYELNNELIEELPTVINYINSKGYNIVTLNKLLQE